MMRSFKLSEAARMMPEALEDALVRGAYLEHSGKELKRMHQEQLARQQAVRATQPPFLFLRPRDTREAYREASTGTAQDLATVERALNVNEKLSKHLHRLSKEHLEKWMRNSCVEYRIGLAAEHFALDWVQSLDRFTEHARTFVRVLGSARNMAPAGYDHVRNEFSPAASDAMKQAYSVALRVEDEIRATNAIAQEHDDMLGKTVFNDPMPRIVQEPYAEVVAKIAGLSPTEAQAEFTRVIEACDDLIDRELEALRSRVRDAGRDHLARTRGYVDDAWSQLHAHALAHSVDRTQIEEVVSQTERLFTGDMQLMTA